ncbi:PREDICTED: zinc finger and BTB domain-containing protein 48 [Drosophila arizonae]|uniref:Zinc finger and BTB domain-containing protein 48 n=1 Tax=Drosophila arizonae TaxID=7263 RepID=A0ABM1PP49_DROAR|nr:PREDICTED: zinc finger and BTB domain-containing protein 48 [Drosophila arizonae]
MSWPCKLAVALQHFSASLPVPTVTANSSSSSSCTNACTCKCKCCSGLIQKYVNFDEEATSTGGPVQKMVRFSTADMMRLLRIAQSCENFWSNQYYKVDLLSDYKALGAAFGAQANTVNVAQLEQIMDTITSGYRRALAKLSDRESRTALRPTAAAPSFPGLRCGCEDCAQLPWCRLQQLEAHQWQHKSQDNWHCRLCYRRYFLQHTLLSHRSRRVKRGEAGTLLENESYKLMLLEQRQREVSENQEQSVLHVPMLNDNQSDFKLEMNAQLLRLSRKRLSRTLAACPQCNRNYLHSYSHQLHIRKHHVTPDSSRRWYCFSCTRSFLSRRIYLQHLRRVRVACRLRLRRFKCSSCRWRFQLERSLRAHVAVAHIRSFSCLICKLPSQSRCCDKHSPEEARAANCARMQRRRLELGLSPQPDPKAPTKVACDMCEREFQNSFLLNIHVKRIHLKQKDFICETCGRGFYCKKEVYEHVRKVHLMHDSVYCEPCGVTIKEKSNYMRHCDSIRHVEMLAKLARLQGELPADVPLQKHVPKGPLHHCESCDRTIKGHAAFRNHCETKFHKRNLERKQEKVESLNEA